MNEEGTKILKVIARHIERVLPSDWWRCIKDGGKDSFQKFSHLA